MQAWCARTYLNGRQQLDGVARPAGAEGGCAGEHGVGQAVGQHIMHDLGAQTADGAQDVWQAQHATACCRQLAKLAGGVCDIQPALVVQSCYDVHICL
jgi:hypothetical protein